ncbi:hypothetical protein GDO81_024746 [Engystomops pustulosus]|uniref:Secreted protein n=1 Tax=Engystomops pustulosus TaxID=76066 RepID=A0AAV6YQQ2_ENGPU|nr:hypothetical protein GDO81_024746 [Engystomops pustulosus]
MPWPPSRTICLASPSSCFRCGLAGLTMAPTLSVVMSPIPPVTITCVFCNVSRQIVYLGFHCSVVCCPHCSSVPPWGACGVSSGG